MKKEIIIIASVVAVLCAAGALNYYKCKIDNLMITVNGETATLTADVTLDAKVYGSSGSWTLPVNVKLRKVGDKWYLGDK